MVVRDGACVVIVPTRLAANGSKVLALPKGHPEEGESPVDAALREVREEAGVLGQLVAQVQAEGGADRDVLVTITQADIAQLAGSSRESASRFLAVLERAAIVTQGRGRITVHDAEALKRYIF